MIAASKKAGWRRFLPRRVPSFASFLTQALLTGCVSVMGIWVEMPWPGVVALGLLGASLMAAHAVPVTLRERVGRGVLTFTWVCTVFIMLASLLLA